MNEEMKYIISRIIGNAYYEVLDVIKSELEAHGHDLKEFGLDVNLEKEFL